MSKSAADCQHSQQSWFRVVARTCQARIRMQSFVSYEASMPAVSQACVHQNSALAVSKAPGSRVRAADAVPKIGTTCHRTQVVP